jgi:hypothetical protein
MGYKKAYVWVPHTALEMKVKCAKNNPKHKPNAPLVIEEEPHFALFVCSVLPHIWGKTGRFTLFFTLLFSCQDVLLSSVQDVIGCFKGRAHYIETNRTESNFRLVAHTSTNAFEQKKVLTGEISGSRGGKYEDR